MPSGLQLRVQPPALPSPAFSHYAAAFLPSTPPDSLRLFSLSCRNRYLQPRFPRDLDFLRRLTAGAVAGLVACSAAYPLDLVRTRLAAQTTSQYYVGILPTLQRIAAEEGPRGLYRGLAATLVQVRGQLAMHCRLVWAGSEEQVPVFGEIGVRSQAAHRAMGSCNPCLDVPHRLAHFVCLHVPTSDRAAHHSSNLVVTSPSS